MTRERKYCVATGYLTYCNLPKCTLGCQMLPTPAQPPPGPKHKISLPAYRTLLVILVPFFILSVLFNELAGAICRTWQQTKKLIDADFMESWHRGPLP